MQTPTITAEDLESINRSIQKEIGQTANIEKIICDLAELTRNPENQIIIGLNEKILHKLLYLFATSDDIIIRKEAMRALAHLAKHPHNKHRMGMLYRIWKTLAGGLYNEESNSIKCLVTFVLADLIAHPKNWEHIHQTAIKQGFNIMPIIENLLIMAAEVNNAIKYGAVTKAAETKTAETKALELLAKVSIFKALNSSDSGSTASNCSTPLATARANRKRPAEHPGTNNSIKRQHLQGLTMMHCATSSTESCNN